MEHLTRGDSPTACDLTPGVSVREFCSGRTGAHGLTTGMAIFEPGAQFPCHFHKFSETLTTLEGEAMVPTGLPHRFLNEGNEPITMVWVYAVAEPERTLVDAGCCAGSLQWNAAA